MKNLFLALLILVAFNANSQTDSIQKPSKLQTLIVGELQKLSSWTYKVEGESLYKTSELKHKSKPIKIRIERRYLNVYNTKNNVSIELTDNEESAIINAYSDYIDRYRKKQQEVARKNITNQ